MRILIMAGGTGGHIFPALAVAKRMQQQGHTVHWLGSRGGMEAGITTANSISIHFVTIGGLRGKGLMTKLIAPWRLYIALLQSLGVILKFKPDVVLGMGGYVTGPAGLAAWILRKRLVIHEQNAIAGMTNQILARFSYKVLEGFPKSFPNKIRAQLTGNPVREDFAKLLPPEKRTPRVQNAGLKILVIGGSGGARTLNNTLPQVLSTWPASVTQPTIWHQAGTKHIEDAKQAYANNSIDLATGNVKLVDFIQDMPNAFMWADIVVCRAGALTVAEIAAAGVASILIPYPYAVDDHQTRNAEYLAQANAAVIIQERDLSVEKLRALLLDFTTNPAKLVLMAKAAYKLAQPEALNLVVANCLECVV
jgi:UDP-N-acetylglucosamine--N-acetylmuramyl-(pentapeptide) pyrophosphoryl-undecaprenol N-acetylglucosamine transferase